jgi:cytochrome c oxidase subunit II
MNEFQLLPDQASTAAPRVDALYAFLWAVSAFFTLLIFVLIAFLALRYRRRTAQAPGHVGTSLTLELAWTIIPFAISMVIFFWGARVFYYIYKPPAQALEVHAIGKQWMWKIQHPNGKREINTLHVPRGQPVKVILASQDTIHSFFIPAFRVKVDAVPGRYTVLWFEATKVGEFHLFCAEYCGTEHSKMIGRVVVLEPDQYEAWLAGTPLDEHPEHVGRALYTSLGCVTCHGSQAPTLAGVYGTDRPLADGRTRRADDQYLRDSILDSTQDVVKGYAPIMPSFRNQISEEQLAALIAYIKSLQNPQDANRTK